MCDKYFVIAANNNLFDKEVFRSIDRSYLFCDFFNAGYFCLTYDNM